MSKSENTTISVSAIRKFAGMQYPEALKIKDKLEIMRHIEKQSDGLAYDHHQELGAIIFLT